MTLGSLPGRLAVVWAAAALSAACYSKTADGTSLVIEADFDTTLGIEQLTFTGIDRDGGVSAFGPATKPPSPNASLPSGQTVRVLLKDGWGGETLQVEVEGLGSNGGVVAWGQQPVAIEQGREVDLKVSLSAGVPPGTCSPGAAIAGPACTGKWCWENPIPESNFLSSVWVANDCSVFAVGGGGAVLQKDAGTWYFPGSGVGQYLSSVWGTSSTDVWAVGDCGTILHWDGTSWSQSVSPNCVTTGRIFLTGVFGTSTDNVWAVGTQSGAGIIEYWDGGSWAPFTLVSAPSFASVWFSGPQDGWAVSATGKIWHFDGANWQGFAVTNSAPLASVFGFSPNDVWAIGGSDAGPGNPQGAILRYQGSGTNWTPLSPAPPLAAANVPFLSMWGTSSENLVAVGADTANNGTAAFLTGAGWAPESLAYAHGASGSPDGTAWITGNSGTVYRGAIGSVGLELPVNLNSSTHPATFNAVLQSGTDVWALGSGGLVLHRDAGWSLYPPPPKSENLQGGWEFAPNDIWAVGAEGLVVHTDGSGTWAPPVLGPKAGNPTWYGAAGRVVGALHELWVVGGDLGISTVSVSGTGTTVTACPMDGGVDAGSLNLRGVSTSITSTVAVGDQGVIVRHNSLTVQPCYVEQVGGPDLKAVWQGGTNDAWAVGSTGTVLRNAGAGWTPLTLPGTPTDNFYAVTGTTQGAVTRDVWVSGNNGTTYHYDVPTNTWTKEIIGSGNTTNAMSTNLLGDVFVVGSDNEILHRSP